MFSRAPNIRSHRAPRSCLPSEQSVGDVWIVQLDRKRVRQARSSGCKSSVTLTAECSRHYACRNLSVDRRERRVYYRTRGSYHLPSREAPARTATGEPDMRLWTWHDLGWVASGVRSHSTGVMWSRRHMPVISRAVVFCTDCNLCRWVSGKPYNSVYDPYVMLQTK